MHRSQWISILCTAALVASFGVPFGMAQEPAPPSGPTSAPRSPAASTSNPGKKKYSHAKDFLIRGTVFSEKALSFPGVQLRVRRAGEKKFRWESYTNSSGEIELRVPQVSDYESVDGAKGYSALTRAGHA